MIAGEYVSPTTTTVIAYNQALSSNQIQTIFGHYQGNMKTYGDMNSNKVTDYAGKVWYITKGADKMGNYTNSDKGTDIYHWSSVLDDMLILKKAANTDSVVGSAGGRLIPDLANYFRYNAYKGTISDI